jgi:heme/copper-type cytochrome/quinol oxidase subunit 3
MSEVAAMDAGVEPAEAPLTPENWGKLGMWLFLAGDAMSFGCLIVGYGILLVQLGRFPKMFSESI